MRRGLGQSLREKVCGDKQRMGARYARDRAGRMRGEGSPVSPYRCPFCTWWHVGHPPSMATVVELAAAIRAGETR